MMTWGIRARLLISFLGLIVLALLLFGSYTLWFFHQNYIDNLTANLLTQAQITEQLIQEKMKGPMEKSSLDLLIKELGTKIDLRITIIDTSGTVLADSWENPAVMENHSDRPEVKAALSGENGTAIRHSSTTNENFLYVSTPAYHDRELIGSVRMATTLLHLESGFRKIESALVAAFLFASLLAMAISIRFAHKYTAPLEEITKIAYEMGKGNLDRRVHVRTGDEVELLGHTLNNLASNLEDKIHEMEAETKKLELILAHMDNAVILLDRYGRVTMANKMAIDSFNITPDLLGQHNIRVIGNSHLDRAVHETINTATGKLIDLKIKLHGTKRVFQVYLAPITGNISEVTGILSVFHDITTLQEIHERQTEFVANASHELATPLTTIIGFTETLLDGALKNPDLSIKFVDIIHSEAERMQRLVSDLLQLARLGSQEYRQQILLQPTPAAPLINEVVQELSPEWQRKNLQVCIENSPQPLIINANPDWFKQVLLNLLDNGIKYTGEGGKILIRSWLQKDFAMFSVRDSGVGIPAQDVPLIFDRFYRADRARSRSAGGTGLGLSIVKFIVEALGGEITVTSETEVGTTFTFSLPIASAEN